MRNGLKLKMNKTPYNNGYNPLLLSSKLKTLLLKCQLKFDTELSVCTNNYLHMYIKKKKKIE